jgi:hypothetical protein
MLCIVLVHKYFIRTSAQLKVSREIVAWKKTGMFINFKVGVFWKRFIARNGGTFEKLIERKIKIKISFKANILNL